MKKNYISILFLLSVLLTCNNMFHEQPELKQKIINEPQPEMKVSLDSDLLRTGTVENNEAYLMAEVQYPGLASGDIWVAIENIGDEILQIQQISIDNNDDYIIDQQMIDDFLPNGINPGTTVIFLMSFQPKIGGVREAATTIQSNDPDESIFTFIIQGQTQCDPRPCRSNSCLNYTFGEDHCSVPCED